MPHAPQTSQKWIWPSEFDPAAAGGARVLPWWFAIARLRDTGDKFQWRNNCRIRGDLCESCETRETWRVFRSFQGFRRRCAQFLTFEKTARVEFREAHSLLPHDPPHVAAMVTGYNSTARNADQPAVILKRCDRGRRRCFGSNALRTEPVDVGKRNQRFIPGTPQPVQYRLRRLQPFVEFGLLLRAEGPRRHSAEPIRFLLPFLDHSLRPLRCPSPM